MTTLTTNHNKTEPVRLRPRRGAYKEVDAASLTDKTFFVDFDIAYRALTSILFNFSSSGHPGGSISAGKTMAALIFEGMDYDFSKPDREEADQVVFAGGHKAMGMYAMWALRDELVRVADPKLLAPVKRRLRFEDLLGFRRNPTQGTPLFKKFDAKPLDGHPTPIVPFVPVATGPSGVGVCSAVGLAAGAKDAFGHDAPKIHVIEGEGGMTPGRVHEVIAAAVTGGLSNAYLHIDWNQASIDSDAVCALDGVPGDYVQWDPVELMRLHDWNVVYAGNGHEAENVHAAMKIASEFDNDLPTAIVYRTVKGWRYGIEGKKSHGGGHKFGSEGYYDVLKPFEERFGTELPRLEQGLDRKAHEQAYWDTLTAFRKAVSRHPGFAKTAASKVRASKERLEARRRTPRPGPRLAKVYGAGVDPKKTPKELVNEAGSKQTLRAALGNALGYLNRLSGGAVLACAADLLDSTSVSGAGKGFPGGFWHPTKNPESRLVAVGGICEDAMGGMMGGVSAFGRHIGVSSSYSAFIAPLEHIPARCHAISQQFRQEMTGEPYRPFIIINGHAGSMTGEDGPTHADPQPLQLYSGNFPKGRLITLTPWDPNEVWPLLAAALKARPAVITPFVTRPAQPVADRKKLGLPPATAAIQGVYAMRRAKTKKTIVLLGHAAGSMFVQHVLPKLDAEKAKVNVFYVASAELFDLLTPKKQESIFPEELTYHSMGITDFTLPTLYRWVRSNKGLKASVHPFSRDHYLGSGDWTKVLEEGRLDGTGQWKAVKAYLKAK
jgi:transketolase